MAQHDGPITTSTFSDDLDVKLTSIGRFERGPQQPMLVGDASNSRLHFFGNNRGYLCSISNINGTNQWENIQAIVSTNTSCSNGDYLGGMTLDNWNNNYGINTYYHGADIVELITKLDLLPTGSPTTHIISTTPIFMPDDF
jgi:hypothetical protein